MTPRTRRRSNPEGRMALRDHLREARNRLIVSLVAVLLGAVAGWFLYQPAFELLQRPIQNISAHDGRTALINFEGVASSLDMQVQGAVFIGILLTCPVWLFEIWAFVTPGLTRAERRYAIGFLSAAVPLFALGAFMAWTALPGVVTILTQFTPPGSTSNIIRAQDYLVFVMRMILVFGVAFVLPVLLVGLNMMRILRGKQILKAWRITVFGIFVLAAMAAPGADALSMFYLALPLVLLYFLAIALCMILDRRRDRRDARTSDVIDLGADTATPRERLGEL
ncbi:twin-arginine translocase subunit TatC [Tersicoccus sp. Bi-70]|uniref:twin-arginine translocase subunit TatC n=1 Tax=Tersicoccus sp. Bi-70 TaxID=1897634 RepID=UPI001E63C60F|nr:twin-arginine translocase subunit TatC [Tersicoccus sp. Bi-70]